jgi:sugar lactone lactonase YvrE
MNANTLHATQITITMKHIKQGTYTAFSLVLFLILGLGNTTLNAQIPGCTLSSSVTPSGASCAGRTDGSAEVFTTGGKGTVTYLWNNTSSSTSKKVTGLAAATYKVVVTDTSGCKDSSTVVVGITNPIIGSISLDSTTSCSGVKDGVATISATGGTAPYSYLWSTSDTAATVDSLQSATYTITITDSTNCKETFSFYMESSIKNQKLTLAKTQLCDTNGTTLTTASSDTGVQYTLYDTSGTVVDGPKAGTGSSLSFSTGTQTSSNSFYLKGSNGSGLSSSSGKALHFDNSNDYVTLPNLGLSGFTEFTTEFWMNRDANGSIQEPVSFGTGGRNHMEVALNWPSGGKLSIATNGYGSPVTTSAPAVGGWHHVAVTYDKSQLKIYVDGVLKVTNTRTINIDNSNYRIGAAGPQRNIYKMDGKLDEVRFWNVARTQAEISANMKKALSGGETGLLAYYNFENGSGTTLSDKTSNAKHGTLQNMVNASWVTGFGASAGGCVITMQDTVSVTVGTGSSITDTATVCQTSYTWGKNGKIYTQSGLHSDTLTNASGCDSILNLQLTLNIPLNAKIDSAGSKCIGSDLDLSKAVGASKIVWSLNGTKVDSSAGSAYATGNTVAGGNGTGSGLNQFNTGTGLVVDSIGNVYISDRYNNRIMKWTPGATTGVVYATGFNVPSGSSIDKNGNIYVADRFNHRIFKIVPGGTSKTVVAGGNGAGSGLNQFNNPLDVFVDDNDTLYICDYNNQRVMKWAPGATSGTLAAGGNGVGNTANKFNYPSDVMLDLQGNLLVVDGGNNRVQKFPRGSNGSINGVTVAGGNGSGKAGNQFVWMNGFSMDNSGNLYVSDPGGRSVKKFPPNSTSSTNGVIVAGGNGGGNAANQLERPTILFFDKTDNLYVLDGNTNARVQKFAFNASTKLTANMAGKYNAVVTSKQGCISNSDTVEIKANPVASAVVDSNISCFGLTDGIATASGTGGVGSYTYSWSNSDSVATAKGLSKNSFYVTVTDTKGCFDSASVSISEPTILNASATLDSNVTCNGLSNGAATAAVTGGTANYSYKWSNNATTASASGLAANSYVVTVTDSRNCIDTASIIIAQPTALVASITLDSNVTCNGLANGSASASATGGTGNYSYAWSNNASGITASGLAANAYIVTVTDSKYCTDTASITITHPNVLVASITLDSNVACNGLSNGAATASATGGTVNYSYAWSNNASIASISALAANAYIVTVTDSKNCSDTASIAITQPSILVASITLDSNVACNGLSNGAATASATGGTVNYSYAWSNSSVNASNVGLIANAYLVTITDNRNCTDTASITITQPAILVASVTLDSNVSCYGYSDGAATASAIGGTVNYSYAWSNNSANASNTGLMANAYVVTVTDSKNCTDTASITITQPIQVIVSFTNPAAVCANSGAFALSGATPTGGTFSGTGVSAGNFNPATAVKGSTSLYYSYTDTNNCTVNDTATIVVDSVPAVTVANFANLCIDADTASLTGGTPTGGSYSGLGINAGNFVTNAAGRGTHIVTYVYSDSNNCTDSAKTSITVDSLPTVALGTIISTFICDNSSSITLNQGMPSGGVYSGSGVSVSNFDPKLAGAGNHTIAYAIVDGNNCSDTAKQSVTVSGAPTVTLAAQAPLCAFDSNLTLTGGLPAGGIYSGIAVNNGSFDPDSALIGNTNITYDFTDGIGCQDSANQMIVVESNPLFSLGADTSTCGDIALTLDAQLGNMIYLWSTVDSTQTVQAVSAGSWSVVVTDTSTIANCTYSDTIKVDYEAVCVSIDESIATTTELSYYPNPTNGRVNAIIKGFEGLDVQLHIVSAHGSIVYHEALNDMPVEYNGHFDLSNEAPGIYFITLTSKKGSVTHRITLNR